MENRIELNIQDRSFRVIAQDETGQTIGYAVAALGKNRALNLDIISVNRCVRGRGIGQEILHEVITVGRRLGARHLIGIFVPEPGYEGAARALYRKFGIDITPERRLSKRII